MRRSNGFSLSLSHSKFFNEQMIDTFNIWLDSFTVFMFCISWYKNTSTYVQYCSILLLLLMEKNASFALYIQLSFHRLQLWKFGLEILLWLDVIFSSYPDLRHGTRSYIYKTILNLQDNSVPVLQT